MFIQLINLTTTKLNCAFFDACVLIEDTPFGVKNDTLGSSKVNNLLLAAVC